jgi:recombinational DNA repair protein (RecF pathway)
MAEAMTAPAYPCARCGAPLPVYGTGVHYYLDNVGPVCARCYFTSSSDGRLNTARLRATLEGVDRAA